MLRDPRPTTSYEPVAPHYDATRHLPLDLVAVLLERVEAATGLTPPAQVLDAGCGTGQLTMPLVRRGHHVTGVDVSPAMLQVARGKVRPGDAVTFLDADVRALPFDDGRFDAVTVSKLFQHVGGWTDAVDELRRITRPGGLFLHVNEKGAFANAVRVRFTELARERGFDSGYPGFADRTELPRHLEARGAVRVGVPTADLAWTIRITYGEALEYLRLRLHSEFWGIPDGDHATLLADTRTWVDDQPGGPDAVQTMTPHLTAEVYLWPA